MVGIDSSSSLTLLALVQVYLILDEFIMGGEIQETSKKVRSRRSHKPGVPISFLQRGLQKANSWSVSLLFPVSFATNFVVLLLCFTQISCCYALLNDKTKAQ